MTTSPLTTIRASLAMALILTTLGAGSSSAAATMLRWKFKPGEVLRYSMVQTQTTTTHLKQPAPQELKQGFTLTIDQTWRVKEVDASGRATLTQTIDRIRTTADLPLGKVTYDSSEPKDAEGPAGPLFKLLVGAEVGFKMDARGQISDVKLPDPMLAKLRGDDEPAGAQGQFSEVGLKNMIARMGLPLPEGPVAPGAQWTEKATIPAGPDGQTREIEQAYAYRGPASGGEAIDLSIKFDPPKLGPDVPVSIKSQESKGRFSFDNAAGRITTSSITESIELAGTIQGQEIAQAAQTTTVLTLNGSAPK